MQPVDASLTAKELLAPIKHHYPRRKVIVKYKDEIFSADLIEMSKEKSYHYILTVIDCFTKFAFAIPLKNKTGTSITEAFKSVFKTRKPEKLWVDKGKEFYNKTFLTFLLDKNVNIYSTESELKAVIIERFNRSLKELLEQELLTQELLGKPRKWLPLLPKVIITYNNRFHRSIQMTPIQASQHPENIKNEKTVLIKEPKYKIDTPVRIYKYKTTFEKGFKPRWTTEVFRISKIFPGEVTTYELRDENGEDIKGRFYEAELSPTYVY